MLGRVKRYLGIEGVKLELVLPELQPYTNRIEGVVRLSSLHPQLVTAIRLVLIEKYSRGRGTEKLTDEYELGSLLLTDMIEVPGQSSVERTFSLPYERFESEVDEFGSRNLLFGGLAKLARLTRGVTSEYRLEAEAKVKGVALSPFDRKTLTL